MEPASLTQAAVSRDEKAWSAFTVLQAQAFIAPTDLARELVQVMQHTLDDRSSTGDAPPMVKETEVVEFLRQQSNITPETFVDFVTLYNRLVDWAHRNAERSARNERWSPAARRAADDMSISTRSNTSPSGRSLSRAATFQVSKDACPCHRSPKPPSGASRCLRHLSPRTPLRTAGA